MIGQYPVSTNSTIMVVSKQNEIYVSFIGWKRQLSYLLRNYIPDPINANLTWSEAHRPMVDVY
jgi:hypothetical protein